MFLRLFFCESIFCTALHRMMFDFAFERCTSFCLMTTRFVSLHEPLRKLIVVRQWKCLLTFHFRFGSKSLAWAHDKSTWTLYRKSRWWKTLQIRTCALGSMTETRGESFYQQLEFDNLTRGKTLLLNIEWFWETLWTNLSLLGCQISWKSIFQSSSDTQFLHRIIWSHFLIRKDSFGC